MQRALVWLGEGGHAAVPVSHQESTCRASAIPIIEKFAELAASLSGLVVFWLKQLLRLRAV
ncbi:MAG: hypothetical protein WCT47_20170 [Betaproteobacteria bacterium]|jgi:hypothetical protein